MTWKVGVGEGEGECECLGRQCPASAKHKNRAMTSKQQLTMGCSFMVVLECAGVMLVL